MTFQHDRLPSPLSHFEGEGLTLKGPGKWRTTACNFHGGSDSMRVHVESGGWVCMACGVKGGDVLAYQMAAHGQDFIEAAKALGAWDDARTPGKRTKDRPRAFSARAAIEVLRFESLLCCVAACNVAQGIALTDEDRLRLVDAAARIELITEEFA